MPVTCPYCQTCFEKSFSINSRHKAVCAGWQDAGVPKTPLPCLCGYTAASLTQMKRHRVGCSTWCTRDRGEVQMARLADTFQAKYGEGVRVPTDIPGVEEKRGATNLAKYGAENVFSKESRLYAKVRESLVGKTHIFLPGENPFSKPEVQAKIRATNLEKYGFENPSKSPVIREKTKATNLERYGTEEALASPILRERITATNTERYGGPTPSSSPEVVEKARQTNLERWGVEWTCQNPEVRAKQDKTRLEHYGTPYYVDSERGKAEIKASLIQKYGVDHPSKIEGFWEKAVATFVERYGVTHPLMLSEFLEKRRITCQEVYGVGSPMQDPVIYAKAYAKACQTNLDRYGTIYPMQNPNVALKALEVAHRSGPNIPEKRLLELVPGLLYTGAGTFWKRLPLLGQYKNPDFILPGPDPEHPKRDVTKVVELFGDYWHSHGFTGKTNEDHESELIQAFAGINIQCLVIWESALYADEVGTQKRIRDFLAA